MGITSKKILITVAAALLIGGGGFTYWQFGRNDEVPTEKSWETQEEKKETDEFKQGLGEQQNSQNNTQPSPPAGQKKTANVFITSWGQSTGTGNVEVSGYITGVYEEGGTCTATLEKDGQKVTGSRAATINAQNISCGFITVERSKLSAGTWKITLAYSSPTAEGNSSPVTLEVK